MNKLFTKIAGLALGLSMAVGVGVAVGANQEAIPAHADEGDTVTIGTGSYKSIYETGFENCTAGTTYNSTTATPYNSTAGDGVSWSVVYGTVSTNDAITNTKSMQMRWYKTASTTYGHAETTSAKASVDAFKFSYKVSNTNLKFDVYYGTNGSTWTKIETVTASSTSAGTYSHEFDETVASFYMKVQVSSLGTAPSSGNYKFIIDDVVFGQTEKEITSLDFTGTLSKTSYYVGDDWDYSGISVTATYSDASTEVFGTVDELISSDDLIVESSPANATSTSVESFTLSGYYGEDLSTVSDRSFSVTVNAARALSSIAVTTAPTKTTYIEGESFDSAGMVVTATYSDASTENVTSSCTFSPSGSLSTSDTSITISYTYSGITRTTTQLITVNERPLADVFDNSYTNSAAQSGWTTFSDQEDYTGVKYTIYTMKPSTGKFVQWNANGYLIATSGASGLKLKSVSIESISSGKTLGVFASNSAYSAKPTEERVATLSDSVLSYEFEDDYSYIGLTGLASSTAVGTLTIEYESLDPTMEYTAGGTTASLHVMNGSTNSTTFKAENFTTTVTASLFSNTSGSHSTLSYSVSGTTVTVTATGTSVGDDSFTISATGCETTLTLNVTVQASTTFDSLVISTASTATEFNEDDPFAVTNIVVTANYTIGGSPSTVEFSAAEGNLDQLTYTVGGNVMEIGDSLTSTGTLAVVVSYTDNTTGTTRSASSYNITVNAYVAHTWTKVTSAPADWRGTYLLVYEDDTDAYIFNSSLTTVDATFNTVSGTISSNSITGSKTIDAVAVKIERNTVSGTSYYHAKCANGGYLKSSNKGIGTQDTATATNAVTFNEDNAMVIGDYILRFNTTANQMRFRFGESSYGAATCLYKMDVTTAINNEVNSFVSGFDTSIGGVCDADGIDTNVSSLNSAWTSQATAFAALSVDAQGILANTTYSHDAETKGSTKDIIDRYDYVYGKYAESLSKGDFMNRTEAGTLVSYSLNRNTPLSLFTESSNVAPIIAIVSIIGVASVGGYFLIRRRKEQ